jgi:hypothetical protein
MKHGGDTALVDPALGGDPGGLKHGGNGIALEQLRAGMGELSLGQALKDGLRHESSHGLTEYVLVVACALK